MRGYLVLLLLMIGGCSALTTPALYPEQVRDGDLAAVGERLTVWSARSVRSDTSTTRCSPKTPASTASTNIS